LNSKADPKAMPENFKSQLPTSVTWKIDNYNHLTEQPTIFYAICGVLGVLGDSNPFRVNLAWAYVILRIIHSLIQTTINHLMMRFAVFVISSVVLLVLTLQTAVLVF